MRKFKFIEDLNPEISLLFNSLDLDSSIKIEFSKEIKDGGYEADFGEFIDRYVTREIMIKCKQDFKDNDTQLILNATYLNSDEMEVLNKFKINNLNLNEIITEDDILLRILSKIKSNKNQKFFRENTFPSLFIKKLKQAYIETITKFLQKIYYKSYIL
jgi:hypothetical protein